MAQIARGTFEVDMAPQAADDAHRGELVGRMLLDKRYSGDLTGTSVGQMLGVRTAVEGSAGYVAMELVTATLDGRSGTFVLQHSASMDRGTQSMHIAVVPDSGTDGLDGMGGSLAIDIADGVHHYTLSYALAPSA